jgi:membrane protease YdiL (CAAX protease family)
MNQHLPIYDARSHKQRDAIYFLLAAALAVYAIGFAVAQTLAATSHALLSAYAHASLIILLLAPAVFIQQSVARRLLSVLALISITRLVSIALLGTRFPQLLTNFILGALLLVAIGMAARALDFSPLRLGLRLWSWPTQLLVGLSGLPLSIGCYLILRSHVAASPLEGTGAVVGTIIVLSFSALAEELLFRGLLQAILKEVFGAWGLILGVALFALSYASVSLWDYVLFLGIVGLFFSWCAYRTGSIHGVALAHEIMLIGAVCVWPAVDNHFRAHGVTLLEAFLLLGGWLCVALLLGLLSLRLLRLVSRAILFVSQQLHR